MLVFQPEGRVEAAVALTHPFIAPYHAPDDEPSADALISLPHDQPAVPLSSTQWRQIIIAAIQGERCTRRAADVAYGTSRVPQFFKPVRRLDTFIARDCGARARFSALLFSLYGSGGLSSPGHTTPFSAQRPLLRTYGEVNPLRSTYI